MVGIGQMAADVGLLPTLVSRLAVASSGVAFVGECLQTLADHHDLREAVAVVSDESYGLQCFNSGRRPFAFDRLPSVFTGRGPGVHTDPALPDEAAELEAIGRLCEVALRLDRLRHESIHDPLTGLYNRRGFDEHLASAVSRSMRYGWTFVLVLIDLDRFKSINDRLGHQGGDAVLRDVAERIRGGLRSGDIGARVGGDEFALLLHVDQAGSTDAILERLHDRHDVNLIDDVGWTTGSAMCPTEAISIDDLYKLADTRLYAAKEARGRRSGA